MWIKRQEGYCLKEIAGVHYLLPYGQKVADQRKGIVLNETGVFLWNELKTSMTDDALAEKLVHYYSADGEAANETQDEIQDQTKDKIQNQMQDQIQDQIRQDVKQFVQELLSLAILQECLRPVCAEDANDATCVYPTKEPFVECLEIAGMRIALYGSRELISSQFDAFLKDCSSAQGKSKSELQTESHIKMQIKMPVQMQIEILQRTTSFHPNGKTLIRNEELVVCENEQGYIILFPSMNQIREAHMTSDGRFAQIYVNGLDKEKTKEELFHAIRHFFLFFAQRQGFFAIHSASILYRDQVWLFSGHSGMGKSTHTNLWKEQFGTEIINGDLNLIGWSNGEQTNIGQNVDKPGSKGHPIVYGMPWCGTSGIASTKSYPLGGIVLLGRSDNDHFESLTNDQKIVRVMQRMISPVWTEDMLETNLKCAAKLAKEVPIYYLLCTKEPSAAQVMKAQIDQKEIRRMKEQDSIDREEMQR